MWRLKICYKERSGLAAANNLNNNIKRFYDEADSDRTYEGDGRDATDFFRDHSNVNDLIDQMSSRERDAFNDFWCPGWFMDGQQYRGWDSMTQREQEVTRIMDKYIDQSRIDQSVQVARLGSGKLLGLRDRARSLEELQALEGTTVFSKGAMSWGAAKQGLQIGQQKNIEYICRIPGGSTGAAMWIGDSRINFWGSRQREVVTNRDVYFSVGKTTYDSSRGVYVVELKYVGRDKHDYGRRGR